MDFIEQVFGWAPDAGDGRFELLLFLIPPALLALSALRRRGRKR